MSNGMRSIDQRLDDCIVQTITDVTTILTLLKEKGIATEDEYWEIRERICRQYLEDTQDEDENS